jgi:hypothetical protein
MTLVCQIWQGVMQVYHVVLNATQCCCGLFWLCSL